jgi:amino acid adenylation domain-containing protein
MIGSNETIHGLLEASASKHPERVAVRDERGAALSYLGLNESASRLASQLVEAGVEPGARVGVLLPKTIDSVVALFAAMKAGAAYVPMDVGAPSQRNHFVARDCRMSALICNSRTLSELRQAVPDEAIAQIDEVGNLMPFDQELKLVSLRWPDLGAQAGTPSGIAYILYTSGSTGNPKGVIHTHASALSFIRWASGEIVPTPDDRFSSHAPFHFDLSIFDLYVPILHGATIVLIGEDLGKQPLRLAPFISEQAITIWYSTPSILRLLVEYGKLDQLSFPDLRVAIFAGEVFPLKHLRRLQDIWPSPRYFNFYGPTETNVCTYFPVPSPVPADAYQTLPIGYPCSEDRGRVVDESGMDVTPGEAGELVIAGGSVMSGYWNLPERNADAFLVDAQGTRWYRTGDLVREDSGLGYQYLGRRDRMIKRRGYRVELGEIEVALHRHDCVSEAAVIALDDTESGVSIHAVVAWNGEGKPSQIALKKYSSENLPAYMIPDRFVFVDALPKTSTDKIDYQRLKGLV